MSLSSHALDIITELKLHVKKTIIKTRSTRMIDTNFEQSIRLIAFTFIMFIVLKAKLLFFKTRMCTFLVLVFFQNLSF